MSDRQPGSIAPVGRSALALALIALIGTALLAWVHDLTAPRIAEQERRQLLGQLTQVIPANRFDNALHEDYIFVRDEQSFPGGQEVQMFRARKGEDPVAVAMKLRANDGYNGRIDLLVGVNMDGTVAGVRVLQHRETPGLGDGIDADRSDWVLGFNGRSIGNPEPPGWTVKREGGVFDQFTGATITPRAVVRAVYRALRYFEAHRGAIVSAPSEFSDERQQNP